MASDGPDDAIAIPGANDGNAWDGNTEDGSVENHQFSHTEHHSHQQVQEPTISVDPAFNASGDSVPDDEDNDGEYDPESVTITAASVPAPAVSPRPSKKLKKVGGFIVGSSDDEDDTPTTTPPPAPSTLKTAPSDTQARIVSPSSLKQSTTSQTTSIVNVGGQAAQVSNAPSTISTAPKSRLPTDIIGLLEDRITDDPRGDLDAWLSLIEEHRRRSNIKEAREVYERFFEVFPQSAEMWVQYVDMELSLDHFGEAERIFQRTLMSIPNVQLWTAYLNYVRRINDLNESTGKARQTVAQSYEFVLNNIGQDRESGQIWHDYIQFIKSGPGQIGGSNWQDMQKMDVLRKAYQRAICIPMSQLHTLWKEYDQFELGLNKVAGRKFLQERSPAYMSARTANAQLDNITRDLVQTTLPRLPPAPGFDGDGDYLRQVDLWKQRIAWEKDDPLVLKSDETETYKSRVIHVYKQALMALRFWPELWVDAAEWCFENVPAKDGKDLGLEFLTDGISANPENALLALKHADRIESTFIAGDGENSKIALSNAVRAPYDKVLDSLYDMVKKLSQRETNAITKIQEDPSLAADADDEEDEGEVSEKPSKDEIRQDRIKAVRDGFAVQIKMLSQQISYVWIALARAFRRIIGLGQGKPHTPSGVRGIFTEARLRGRLTSDVYVAMAHIEWDIYQDKVATKIFDRGAKLFPHDEHFMVAYLKHLHARHDTTNARVVFSQTAKRFKEKPELVPKLKPLYAYFHSYEAKCGELAQIKELEKQMAESFPEDPSLSHFAARFSSDNYNPIAARVIISPMAQMRPKHIMQSVERASVSARDSPLPSVQLERSPRPHFVQAVNSPKRPFPADDQDDYNPPRKLARGVSPLKGAAGRRLDQQRRQQGGVTSSLISTPAPISRDITFMLSLIPPPEQFDGQRFKPDGIVRMIQNTSFPDPHDLKAQAPAFRNNQPNPRAHARQVSTDYPAFAPPFVNRDSPAPTGRPYSPYVRGGSREPQQPQPSWPTNQPLGYDGSNPTFPPGAYPPPPPSAYPQQHAYGGSYHMSHHG